MWHMGSCKAAAHREQMLRRSQDQPWAECIPALYTHSSPASRRSHLSRTNLLQAPMGLEKMWRMAFHSSTSVGPEVGNSGWSMCMTAGKRDK